MKDRRKHYKKGPESSPEMADEQHGFCVQLIKKMLKEERCEPFSKPVTELWDIQELPGYFDAVKQPMDLGTIQENLSKKVFYSDKTELFDYRKFIDAVYLVFENCQRYNDPGSDFHNLAEELFDAFDEEMRSIPRNRKEGSLPSVPDDSGNTPGEGAADSGANDEPGDAESDGEEEAPVDESEIAAAQETVTALEEKRTEAQKIVDEVDVKRGRERTEQERQELRDVIEGAPWETVDQVVKLLRSYVNKALESADEEDPEFVTIEMNSIEPELLAQVENVVRPDAKREEAMKQIKTLNGEIETAQMKLKNLKKRGSNSVDRKKSKKRR